MSAFNEIDRDSENEARRFVQESGSARFHGEPEMRVEWGVLMGENVSVGASQFSSTIAAEALQGEVVRRTVTTSRWEEV